MELSTINHCSSPQSAGRIFVNVRRETEKGLCPSDAVVVIHRFGGGDLPPDMVHDRWGDSGSMGAVE